MKKRIISLCISIIFILIATNSLATYETLRPGSSGDMVATLQDALKEMGFKMKDKRGYYGKYTKNAVYSFQKQHKISADGSAGDQTLSLIFGSDKSGSKVQNSISLNSSNVSVNSVVLPSASLRPGASGQDVINMQLALIKLGYLNTKADGSYGAMTTNAVKAFQKKYRMSQDGIAGIKTLKLLYAKAGFNILQANTAQNSPSNAQANTNKPNIAPSSNNAGFVLKIGDSGSRVLNMQNALSTIGYNTNGVDGKFGKGTLKAIYKFQRNHGLKQNGIVDSNLLNAIYSELAQKTNANAYLNQANTQANTNHNNTTSVVNTNISNSILRPGMSGKEVLNLQNNLKKLGFLSGKASGTYDSATSNAVLNLQKQYELGSDGVAGPLTQETIYKLINGHGSEKLVATLQPKPLSFAEPNKGQIQLLHWYNDVKNSIKNGDIITVFDPQTKASWKLKAYSRGRHLDAEPLTASDTEELYKGFKGKKTWTPNDVYVQLPDGRWTLATTHDVAHAGFSIKDNNFNGHLCVHFLRDKDETSKNDPHYGIQNQLAIRSVWKALTGQVID